MKEKSRAIVKTCAKCGSKEVVFVLIKKDEELLHLQWVCIDHLLQLIERMNQLYPDLDYVAKVRKS